MIRRIFYVLLAVFTGLLGYGIYGALSLRADLSSVPKEYAFGPDEADLTVVEFMDYACDYCREVYPVITEAVKRDGKVRYVVLPLLTEKGGTSNEAARITYAAALQGKYKDVLQEFIGDFRAVDEKRITDLSLKLGLDAEKLKADMNSPAVIQSLNRTIKVYGKTGSQLTPTFMIGPGIIYVPTGRKPTAEDFLDLFRQARGS